jgi:RNA polymerase sigma-70 factor (ECF subfamily)
MVGTDEVAEDITQEVLFRVYTVIDRIDPTKKFTTFLFEIAKNKSIDYIRARKSTSSIEEMEIADNSLPLEEILFEEEKKKTLQQAIHHLPEHYRTVILLYYFDELSYEEIAKQLNLPINTVRTRLKRAKEQLKHTIIL